LAAIRDDLRTLADLGYEGEANTIVVAFKKPKNGQLTDLQQTFNRAHNRLRAVGERGNSLLKVTFTALRNVSLNPGASATSPPQPWPFSTSTTPEPPEKTHYTKSHVVTREGAIAQ
jgi:hypothetical protein